MRATLRRAALVSLGVAGVGALRPPDAGAQELDVAAVGYVLGDSAAPVEVVEFGDFACSACAEFWRETWPSVQRDLVRTGRVSWRHVPFLLGFDRSAEGANAAECAAEQDRFWSMHDQLFESQAEWTRIRRPEEAFMSYADAIGLDVGHFDECYKDGRGEERTRAANRAAREARVRGTPTFFVNGRQAVGALSYDMFLALVEEAERLVDGR